MFEISATRKVIVIVAAAVLAAAVALVLILIFLPSGGGITINEGDWPMPGGGPSHTSYLPLAPKGQLRERWSTRLEGEPVGPPAVAGDRIYISCDNGFLYCLELETGLPVWRFDAGSGMTAMPAVSERGIVVGTVDGRVLHVNPEGELGWEVEVGGAVLSTPIPWEGRIFFGSSDKHLYCLEESDGSTVWSFAAEGPIEVSPCIYENQVFGASYEGDLFALDAEDGRLVWTLHSKGVPVVFPAADDGRVFLATEFQLYCADAQSGKLLWEYATGPIVISNLAVRGNQVVVVRGGSGEVCNTISLDNRTGDLLWNVVSGESAERTVLFASNEDVYLCGPDQLRGMAVESGTPSMESELRGIIPHTLTLTERFAFVGSDTRKVYCLEE